MLAGATVVVCSTTVVIMIVPRHKIPREVVPGPARHDPTVPYFLTIYLSRVALVMMSGVCAQVLNWDLRPVTIYDFVRAFCAILPAVRAAAWSPSSSSSREEDREDMEQLVDGAEEIADLSSCGAFGVRTSFLFPRMWK